MAFDVFQPFDEPATFAVARRYGETLTVGFDGVDRYGYASGQYGNLQPAQEQGQTVAQLTVDTTPDCSGRATSRSSSRDSTPARSR